MKIRNLTTHAIQFMFQKNASKEQPEFDFVHLPPAMGKGYVIIDDEIWDKIKDQTIRVPKLISEEETVEGVLIDNKPIVHTVQVPSGDFYQLNVVSNLLKQRKIEFAEDAGDTRLAAEVKMIDDLNDLGFAIDADIDSGKLAKLHARIFPNDKPVLTPAK